MKKELDEALCQKYPKIFRYRHSNPQESPMCFGFECGDGWFQLLDTLCGNLQFMTDKNGYPQVIAGQVKEKYGRIRIYWHAEGLIDENDESVSVKYSCLDGMIAFASEMSTVICEECGNTHKNGIQNIKGWYRSICNECYSRK